MTVESQASQLVGLVDAEHPFDMPFAEVLPRQLQAINERCQDRVHKIKLLKNRADNTGLRLQPRVVCRG